MQKNLAIIAVAVVLCAGSMGCTSRWFYKVNHGLWGSYPGCGCECACNDCCGCGDCCGEVSCGCEPACGFESGCGCEPACGFEPGCGCEPACGFEPGCGCEPACGFEPGCGCEPGYGSGPCGPGYRYGRRRGGYHGFGIIGPGSLVEAIRCSISNCWRNHGLYGCEPECDCDPSCGYKPGCGCGPSCCCEPGPSCCCEPGCDYALGGCDCCSGGGSGTIYETASRNRPYRVSLRPFENFADVLNLNR